MPSDARLGLVAGVCLVIAVAVAFYRTDGKGVLPTGAVGRPITASAEDEEGTEGVSSAAPAQPGRPRLHKVEEGETLTSLALKYYGDRSRASLLFRSNRDQLHAPDRVPVGTVLRIPELTKELAGKAE